MDELPDTLVSSTFAGEDIDGTPAQLNAELATLFSTVPPAPNPAKDGILKPQVSSDRSDGEFIEPILGLKTLPE